MIQVHPGGKRTIVALIGFVLLIVVIYPVIIVWFVHYILRPAIANKTKNEKH